jgi:4-amino-4-deoxy-L-arabinose transferase-like glycosyltransferase
LELNETLRLAARNARGLFARNLWFSLALSTGVALRLYAFAAVPVSSDAAEYGVMAASFLRSGEFFLPFGEYWDDTWTPGPSHHYPPVYPVFLAPFVAAFGLSPLAVKAGGLAASCALLAVAYLLTSRLYGAHRARWVAALLGLDPILVVTTGTGYAENLVALLFVSTLYSIIRSVDSPRWMLAAGLLAGLTYLTKSSLGPFFLIAGAAGFGWRFLYLRWAVLRDLYYLGAIAIFLGMAALWAARNLAFFWTGSPESLWDSWQTSRRLADAENAVQHDLAGFAFILVARLPLLIAFFLLVAGPWLGDLRRLPKIAEQRISLLWLAVGLTYLLAWLISSMFWVLERSSVWWVDVSRYTVVATPAILWMAIQQQRVSSRSFRLKLGAAASLSLVACAAMFVHPAPGVFDAYEELRCIAEPGESVALDRVHKYEAMVNLEGSGLRLEPYGNDTGARFIISGGPVDSRPGYRLVAMYGKQGGSALMPGFGASLWEAENRTGAP